jgi:hypothetical protein
MKSNIWVRDELMTDGKLGKAIEPVLFCLLRSLLAMRYAAGFGVFGMQCQSLK